MPSLAWGIPPSLTTRLHFSCRSMSSEIVSVTTRRCKYPAWLSALPHHSVSPHVSPSCSTPHPYTPAGTSDCATVLPLRSPHRPPASPCPQTDPRRAPCVLQATHNSSCPIPSVSLPTTSEKDSPPPQACMGVEIPWAVGAVQSHKNLGAGPHIPCTALGDLGWR